MKIRSGFVSNSSSSSFIIGIGAVNDTDYKKVIDIIEETNMKYYVSLDIYDGNPKNLSVESFDGSFEELNPNDVEEGDFILKLSYYGDEGDHYFTNHSIDDYDEPNYDNFEFEDFDHNIVDFVNKITTYYVKDFKYSYGAGRNG